MLRRLGLASAGRFGRGCQAFSGQEALGAQSLSANVAGRDSTDEGDEPGPRQVSSYQNGLVGSASSGGSAMRVGYHRTAMMFGSSAAGHASLLHGSGAGLAGPQAAQRGFASTPWFSSGKKAEGAAGPDAAAALPGGEESGAPMAENVGGTPPVELGDPVEFASAVTDALGQAETLAQTAAVDSSWYLTGKVIEGMCYATEALGVPWWVSIAGVTAGVRLLIFPLMVWLESTKLKMQKIQPHMEKLKEKYPGLYQGDKAAQEGFSRETTELFKKHNMSPQSALYMLPISLSQVFIFGTFFFCLQNLCAAKLPSLMTGGALWFPDLSVPDTTYILPAAGAGLMLATVELNASDMGSADQSGMMKSFMRIMSVAFLGMGGYLPSGMFVYFVTTNGFTLGQVAVMRSTAFRNLVGLPKVPPPAAVPAGKQESFTEMYNRYLRQAEELQKQGSGEATKGPETKFQGIKTFSVKQQGRKRRGGGSK